MEEKAYNYRVDTVAMGRRIRETRRERNISLKKMEDYFGISRQALNKWERGATVPEIQNLLALAHLLNVSIEFLLVGDAPLCAA